MCISSNKDIGSPCLHKFVLESSLVIVLNNVEFSLDFEGSSRYFFIFNLFLGNNLNT